MIPKYTNKIDSSPYSDSCLSVTTGLMSPVMASTQSFAFQKTVWTKNHWDWCSNQSTRLGYDQHAIARQKTTGLPKLVYSVITIKLSNIIRFTLTPTLPKGHLLMVFIILLPKKILSRQLERIPLPEQEMNYGDFDLVSADNMTQNDISLKFDDEWVHLIYQVTKDELPRSC